MLATASLLELAFTVWNAKTLTCVMAALMLAAHQKGLTLMLSSHHSFSFSAHSFTIFLCYRYGGIQRHRGADGGVHNKEMG